MKKLTLADCANVKISDLYLGFVLFETGPEYAEAIACKAMPPLYGVVMFLLELDGHYYNLNASEDASEDDPENAIRIDLLEPLSDYYSEEEYRFVEVNGKVCLDVNSPEPYERYEEKVTANIEDLFNY